MISSLKLSIILIFTFGLVKFSVSLMPAKFIQGSQPKTKTLHDTGFQTPLALHTRRSQSSTTAVYASSDDDDIASMKAGAMKKELESYGISTDTFVEKSELVQALTKARADGLKPREPQASQNDINANDGCMLHPKHPIKIFATDRDKGLRRKLPRLRRQRQIKGSSNCQQPQEEHWSTFHSWTFEKF